MSPATWRKQGKPPHPGTRPGAAPAPVAQPAAVPWQDAGRGWSLWPRGFTRPSPAGRAAAQDCTFGVPAAAGRAPEAAAPRLPASLRSPAGPGSAYSLFPITAGAGLCATTPHHTGPSAAVAPRSSGASPGTSRLRQHLSPRPLPCLQFCITAHALSNTCEQVRKPGHSSYHSCRDAGSIGISWTFQQRDDGTILQAPEAQWGLSLFPQAPITP